MNQNEIKLGQVETVRTIYYETEKFLFLDVVNFQRKQSEGKESEIHPETKCQSPVKIRRPTGACFF